MGEINIFRKIWRPVRTAGMILLCLLLLGTEVFAADGYDQVAGKSSLASAKKNLASYGMTPVYGIDVEDGEYIVSTECSSSFFRIEQAKLLVKDGQMTAVLTMSSSSYLLVYPGTAEEAAAAPFEDYIPSVEIDTWDTFTIPVEALDKELDLAAFSKRKKMWYPRRVLFHASDIPAECLKFEYPDYERIEEAMRLYDEEYGNDSAADLQEENEDDPDSGAGPEAVTMEMPDGEYSIEVVLSGGSGRASVTSPTWLTVEDGKGYARILWSSTYYDYMILDGKKFLNETTDGSNSSFTIPITTFNEPVEVIADTTAMGDPLEIEYTLTFYSDTVGAKSRVPQEAAKRVLLCAAVVIILGGIINYFVKRKRQ